MFAEMAFGISVVKGANTLYESITGNTLTRDIGRFIRDINGLEPLSDHVALSDLREVAHRSGPTQAYGDIGALAPAMSEIQTHLDHDLIMSQPIVTPDRFRDVFAQNPEDLLSYIQPLTGNACATPPGPVAGNPTYVPVVFDRWGQSFVGWTKRGVLSLTLDTDYDPLVMRQIESLPGVTIGQSPGAATPPPANPFDADPFGAAPVAPPPMPPDTDLGPPPPPPSPSPQSGAPVPAPASGSLTVGPGQAFASIADAIAASAPGAAIDVYPGHYTGHADITHEVYIAGIGNRDDIVWEGGSDWIIAWGETGGRIENLTLHARGACPGVVVFGKGSTGQIAHCALAGTDRIAVIDDGANPIVADGAFTGAADCAIQCSGQGMIEGNSFHDIPGAGVRVFAGASPLIQSNRFTGCGSALVYSDKGEGTAKGNDIESCKAAAVVIGTGANPMIDGNSIRDGADCGILIDDAGRGLISENTVAGNTQSGIYVGGGGDPFVSGNTIDKNAIHGIVVCGARGIYEKNAITGSGDCGVVALEGGGAFVTRNIISGSGGYGIWVTDRGEGIFAENDLRANTLGGVLTDPDAGPASFDDNHE